MVTSDTMIEYQIKIKRLKLERACVVTATILSGLSQIISISLYDVN